MWVAELLVNVFRWPNGYVQQHVGAPILPGTILNARASVQTTATEAEIKKAYYVKARQCHPDKKQDDELANEQFQQLGEVRSRPATAPHCETKPL